MAAPLNLGVLQFFDSSGKPLAGGTVDLFVPGTITRKNSWTNADEAGGHLNANPITLDAGGRATIFVEGYYEAVIKDALGNQLVDCMGSAFTISSAMGTVLQAASVYDAFNLMAANGGSMVGNFGIGGNLNVSGPISTLNVLQASSLTIPTAGELVVVTPVNIAAPTRSSFAMHGQTQYPLDREFLACIGLQSNLGAGNVGADKVALQVGFEGQLNSGSGWAGHFSCTAGPSTGVYNMQGIEIDITNYSYPRGNNGNYANDYNGANCPIYGLQIGGGGYYTNTAALLIGGVSSISTTKWGRGIALVGNMQFAGIADSTNSFVGYQFDGNYALAAINMTVANGNQGANTVTAMYMKRAHAIAWQNNAGTGAIFDGVTAGEERYIGYNATGTAMGTITYPATPGLGLGRPGQPWGDTYIRNTNVDGDVFPTPSNTHSLGTPDWFWLAAYLQGGVVSPSDVSLKNTVTPLPDVTELIKNVNPIRFKWNETDGGRPGRRMHWGFDAENIAAAFKDAGHDFGGYLETSNGTKALRPAQLIPVLWQGLKDVIAIVDELKAQLDAKKND